MSSAVVVGVVDGAIPTVLLQPAPIYLSTISRRALTPSAERIRLLTLNLRALRTARLAMCLTHSLRNAKWSDTKTMDFCLGCVTLWGSVTKSTALLAI